MIAVVVVASLEALLSQMEGGYSILLIIASALSLLPHLSCCLAGMKEEGGHTKRNAASAIVGTHILYTYTHQPDPV